MIEILRILPKNYLSFIIGKLADLNLPVFILKPIKSWFTNRYGVNLEEAEHSFDYYKSLSKFFVRNLKPGVRPIIGNVVSPVDGRTRSFGDIKDETIHDVKGQSYTLSELFKGSLSFDRFKNGIFFNFYLAPGDYHHIHAPVSGQVKAVSYIPGKLWPVNDWSLINIPKLFSQNERIVTLIESNVGMVAVVMVGATNVGKITLEFDPSIIGNRISLSQKKEIYEKEYEQGISLAAGDRIGTFHLGSSVILLFENKKLSSEIQIKVGQKIKFGEALTSDPK